MFAKSRYVSLCAEGAKPCQSGHTPAACMGGGRYGDAKTRIRGDLIFLGSRLHV